MLIFNLRLSTWTQFHMSFSLVPNASDNLWMKTVLQTRPKVTISYNKLEIKQTRDAKSKSKICLLPLI